MSRLTLIEIQVHCDFCFLVANIANTDFEKMGVGQETYVYEQKERLTVKGIVIDAVTVKHAADMECFGYIIQVQDGRIYLQR